MLMSEKEINRSDNFVLYEDEKSINEAENIEENHKNMVGKGSNTERCIKDSLSGCISQNRMLGSELSLSLKEVRFY